MANWKTAKPKRKALITHKSQNADNTRILHHGLFGDVYISKTEYHRFFEVRKHNYRDSKVENFGNDVVDLLRAYNVHMYYPYNGITLGLYMNSHKYWA